jgi:hypothetical protein
MIYLTAIGWPPGGSCSVHIYTQTIQETSQNKQYIEQHKKHIEQHKKCIEQQKIRKSAGRASLLRVSPWHLPYNWGKSTGKTSVSMCLFCHVAPPSPLTSLSWPHELSETQWPLYVPTAWTLKKTTCFTHRVYLCVSCDFQNKQLLFPQISLTDNGDAVCFCEYRTEFSNSLFISTHLLLSAVGRTNDDVAWIWRQCCTNCKLCAHISPLRMTREI